MLTVVIALLFSVSTFADPVNSLSAEYEMVTTMALADELTNTDQNIAQKPTLDKTESPLVAGHDELGGALPSRMFASNLDDTELIETKQPFLADAAGIQNSIMVSRGDAAGIIRA